MWWAPHGERVLRGAEWELFREGLETLWDWVEESSGDPDIFDSGIEAFDRLQIGQKLALLALVGRALSDEGMPHPDLTVNTEAVVAAIFRQIASEVPMEIDQSGDPEWVASLESPEELTHWRRLVLAAHREAELQDEAEALANSEGAGRYKPDDLPDDEDEPWSPPDVTSEDAEEWEFLVDCLANRILWEDGDYEAGDDFLDADPTEGRARMAMLGIADDYYTDIAPDPTDEQLEPVRRTLRSLCGRPEPKEPELIDGIRDVHHDLLVGPCDAETIANEVACHLVEEVGVLGEDGFDCSHAEWAGLFREEVHRVASAESPGLMVREVVLSQQQMAEAAQARESGKPLVLEGGLQVELREGGWIVADRHGDVLVDIEEPTWIANGTDPDMPPLKFPTPKEALIGCLWAEMIAAARSERYEAAMKRLGRE